MTPSPSPVGVRTLLDAVFGGVLTPGPHPALDHFRPQKASDRPKVNARELRTLVLGAPWSSFPEEAEAGSLLDIACHSVEGGPWESAEERTKHCLPFALLASPTPAEVRGVHWLDRVRDRVASEVVPSVLVLLAGYLESIPDPVLPDTASGGDRKRRKGGATRSDVERVQRARSLAAGMRALAEIIRMHGAQVLPTVAGGVAGVLAAFPPGVVLFTSGKSKKDAKEAIRETAAGLLAIQCARSPWDGAGSGRSKVQSLLDAGVGSFGMLYTAAGPTLGQIDRDVLGKTASILVETVGRSA